MDFFAGVKGNNFVMVVCDTSATQSIVTIKQDEDKIVPLDSHRLFCLSGEAGDRVQFSEYITANVKLYTLRNTRGLSTKAVAHYTRGELANALRRSPYQCNLLLAGYDENAGPSLYWIDYLATMCAVNTGGTGYGNYFVQATFDKLWRPDMSQDEALDMIKKGIAEVKLRLVVAPAHYRVKVVDRDGIRTVADL